LCNYIELKYRDKISTVFNVEERSIMNKVNGELMSKEAFINNAPYTKEPYKGFWSAQILRIISIRLLYS